MNYFENVKSNLQDHIRLLETLVKSSDNGINQKIKNHYEASKNINNSVNFEDPKKLKLLIEYVATESRGFGWSFPENNIEELCEDSFWEMKNKLKRIVGGMTVNERLYYFGYFQEFENIPSTHKSDKDRILQNLFVGEN